MNILHNENRYKDFGFNGYLYNMPISVYPIYENINVYSRGYNKGAFFEAQTRRQKELTDDEKQIMEFYGFVDLAGSNQIDDSYNINYDDYAHYPNYLIDTILVKDYSLKDFIVPAKILGMDINIVCLEYMIASKEIALSNGILQRKFNDEYDLAFLKANAEKLSISEEKRNILKAKTVCEIDRAYTLWDGYIAGQIDKEEYIRRKVFEPVPFDERETRRTYS